MNDKKDYHIPSDMYISNHSFITTNRSVSPITCHRESSAVECSAFCATIHACGVRPFTEFH